MPIPTSTVTRTAGDLAAGVRAGHLDPRDVLEEHLGRIDAASAEYGAFQLVRADDARQDAERIAAAASEARAILPLAGVPVAVKDNVDLAGEPTRVGSRATPSTPAAADHVVVERLRRAGAVIVGKTRVPELCLWGTTDGAFGTARTPWGREHTAGGSSGGSAAAVAAAMVPVAHGNDGLGSIRIPAACCGLVGIKPGLGLVPADLAAEAWFGMSENGALATTVADAALMLSVLADDPGLAAVTRPERPLRIALALEPPSAGLRCDRELAARVRDIAGRLATLGHEVEETKPPMPSPRIALAILGTWGYGAARDVDAHVEGDPTALDRLERRTLRHARWGRVAHRLGLVHERDRRAWKAQLAAFLGRYDVMLTPTLARLPLKAEGWRNRSWLANVVANVTYAPYCGPVNFAQFPAVAVPAGVHSSGLPASAHLVGRPGSERLLLGVASLVESELSWPRHAPAVLSSLAAGYSSTGTRPRA